MWSTSHSPVYLTDVGHDVDKYVKANFNAPRFVIDEADVVFQTHTVHIDYPTKNRSVEPYTLFLSIQNGQNIVESRPDLSYSVSHCQASFKTLSSHLSLPSFLLKRVSFPTNTRADKHLLFYFHQPIRAVRMDNVDDDVFCKIHLNTNFSISETNPLKTKLYIVSRNHKRSILTTNRNSKRRRALDSVRNECSRVFDYYGKKMNEMGSSNLLPVINLQGRIMNFQKPHLSLQREDSSGNVGLILQSFNPCEERHEGFRYHVFHNVNTFVNRIFRPNSIPYQRIINRTKQEYLGLVKSYFALDAVEMYILYIKAHGEKEKGVLIFQKKIITDEDNKSIRSVDSTKYDEVYLHPQEIYDLYVERYNHVEKSQNNQHSRLFIVVDTCYSGQWIDVLDGLDDKYKKQIAVQTSCSSDELSLHKDDNNRDFMKYWMFNDLSRPICTGHCEQPKWVIGWDEEDDRPDSNRINLGSTEINLWDRRHYVMI